MIYIYIYVMNSSQDLTLCQLKPLCRALFLCSCVISSYLKKKPFLPNSLFLLLSLRGRLCTPPTNLPCELFCMVWLCASPRLPPAKVAFCHQTIPVNTHPCIQASNAFLCLWPHCVLRQVLSLNSELSVCYRLSGRLDLVHTLPFSAEVLKKGNKLGFRVGRRSKLRVSGLQGKHFTKSSSLPPLQRKRKNHKDKIPISFFSTVTVFLSYRKRHHKTSLSWLLLQLVSMTDHKKNRRTGLQRGPS